MNFFSLNQLPLYTDDFFFRHLDDINQNDALVIFNPTDCITTTPVFLKSRKTLEEHIALIRSQNLNKAIIVAEDIQFLKRCPSLEHIWILPAISADNFDYSPIYQLPYLKSVRCETIYGVDEEKSTTIDYANLKSARKLIISGSKGHINVKKANHAETLYFDSGYPNSETLTDSFSGESLMNFSICTSPIISLSGIEGAKRLQNLSLDYNRRLTDISALSELKDSLRYLKIDTCGRIKDFSALSELHNLEELVLKGSNRLPNLSFLDEMPKLKNLHLTMNVDDGDLSSCEKISYVRIQNRKHYSHKDKDLPKNYIKIDKLF